jgi:hypothetical protein
MFDEPSAADLAAIEAEWPVVEAELGVLDAEIAVLTHDGGPSPLDWRRLRRARRRLLATVTGQRGAASLQVGTLVTGRDYDFGGAGIVTGRDGHRVVVRFGAETIAAELAYFVPAGDGPRDGAA